MAGPPIRLHVIVRRDIYASHRRSLDGTPRAILTLALPLGVLPGGTFGWLQRTRVARRLASSRRNSRTPSGGGQTRTGGGPLSAPQTPSCPAVGSVRHRLQRTTTWALAPARPAPTDSPTVAQSATNPDTPRGIATPRPQHRRTNTPTRVSPRARASNARPLDRRRQGRTPSSTGQRVLLTSLRARLSSSRLLSATPRRTKTFHPPPSQAFLQSRPPLACAANPLAFILSVAATSARRYRGNHSQGGLGGARRGHSQCRPRRRQICTRLVV